MNDSEKGAIRAVADPCQPSDRARAALAAKHCVVVADDDDGLRSLLVELLENSGYEIQPAANGNEAMARCESAPPAAAIIDLVMPEKEGLETIFEFHRRFPSVRLIAISGGGRAPSDTYLAMARKLGADAAVAKPFCAREILDTLSRLLPSSP